MNVLWKTHQFTGTDASPSVAAKKETSLTAILGAGHEEWLLANSTGAFSMGTIAAVNTRRYHGLLVAATRPPVGRVVVLNQVIERLTFGQGENKKTLDLSGCLFQDSGDASDQLTTRLTHLARFEKGLSVRWTYRGPAPDGQGSFELSRQVTLHWQHQAVSLNYEVKWDPNDAPATTAPSNTPYPNNGPVTLTLEPLLTLRDFHSLLHMRNAGPISVGPKPDGLVTLWRGDLAATIHCPAAQMTPLQAAADPFWYGIHYPREAERGQDHVEDNIAPARYSLELPPGQTTRLAMTVALGETPVDATNNPQQARAAHLESIRSKLAAILTTDPPKEPQKKDAYVLPEHLDQALAIAADDFVVARQFDGQSLSTILAGYPWFADWGRDTFISLPGLLLTTGRFDEARGVLHAFAKSIRNGLVPNRFDDYSNEAAHYNAVDASLWFVHAAIAYFRATKDQPSWDDWLRQAVMDIIEAYIRGTDHDIRMAGDALVSAGSPGTQLTWMDAARDGTVFTPRHGKAVEVNALWYSNLSGMSELLADTDRPASEHYRKLTQRISRAFTKLFWDPKRGCLNDHVWVDADGNEQTDPTIRPNQIFAVSLPFTPLPRTRQRKVLAVVRDQLLTPFGLRTLSPDDPDYHPHYRGTMYERDSAYHRGTVWPWLIGPYAEAVLRVGDFSPKAKTEARKAIAPLLDRLMSTGLGQLNEIHEADPPHAPVGCIAQAWSVAEIIRVLGLMAEHGEK